MIAVELLDKDDSIGLLGIFESMDLAKQAVVEYCQKALNTTCEFQDEYEEAHAGNNMHWFAFESGVEINKILLL